LLYNTLFKNEKINTFLDGVSEIELKILN